MVGGRHVEHGRVDMRVELHLALEGVFVGGRHHLERCVGLL